jgi:hypothetical protein
MLCLFEPVNIQYWCIDGKYIIDGARLRNGGKASSSVSLHTIRAEPHILYTPILYLSCNKMCKKDVN